MKLFVRIKPPRSPLRNESMCFLGPVHAGHCQPHPSLLPPALQLAVGRWQGVRRKEGSEAAPQPLAFEAGGSPSPLQPPPPPFWAEKKRGQAKCAFGVGRRMQTGSEMPQCDGAPTVGSETDGVRAPLPDPWMGRGCRAETPKTCRRGGSPARLGGRWKQAGSSLDVRGARSHPPHPSSTAEPN